MHEKLWSENLNGRDRPLGSRSRRLEHEVKMDIKPCWRDDLGCFGWGTVRVKHTRGPRKARNFASTTATKIPSRKTAHVRAEIIVK